MVVFFFFWPSLLFFLSFPIPTLDPHLLTDDASSDQEAQDKQRAREDENTRSSVDNTCNKDEAQKRSGVDYESVR